MSVTFHTNDYSFITNLLLLDQAGFQVFFLAKLTIQQCYADCMKQVNIP